MPDYSEEKQMMRDLQDACRIMEDLLWELEQEDMQALRKQREQNKKDGLCRWHLCEELNIDISRDI